MKEKYILISLEDEKAKHLSGILSNKTCKKIIDFLAEKSEASEKEISDELKIPINTVEYNLKKLIKSELIEKSKNFFWSKKGRKIDMYKLSNKSIIISPKNSNLSSKLKSALGVSIVSIIGTIILAATTYKNKLWTQSAGKAEEAIAESVLRATFDATTPITAPENFINSPTPIVLWFLIGALFAIVIYTILSWRKL